VTPVLTLTDAPGRELSRALAVLSSDPDTKEVIGGQLGRTSLGILFVDLLFIPAALRGQDLGGRVARCARGRLFLLEWLAVPADATACLVAARFDLGQRRALSLCVANPAMVQRLSAPRALRPRLRPDEARRSEPIIFPRRPTVISASLLFPFCLRRLILRERAASKTFAD